MKSEIAWKPGANVMTTPKPTDAEVKKIGVIAPFAPKLTACLCDGIYRWKAIADTMTPAAKPISTIFGTFSALPAKIITIKTKIGRILRKNEGIYAFRLANEGVGMTIIPECVITRDQLHVDSNLYTMGNPTYKNQIVISYKKDTQLSPVASAFLQFTKKRYMQF